MDVPGHAQMLVDFVNTYEVDGDEDVLRSPADLDAWLAERTDQRIQDGRAARCTRQDLDRARELRERLRGVLATGHGEAAHAIQANDAAKDVTRAFPLVVDLSTEPPTLRPQETSGARVGVIAAAVATAAADGSWARIKVCQVHTCLWAFYDSSKNASRTWCSMRVCGNRAKTASYRGRQRLRTRASAAEGQPV